MTTTTSFWHHPIWQRPLITALATTLALSLLGCQPDAPNTQTSQTKTAQATPTKTQAKLHPERTYVGKHNYITYEMSGPIKFHGVDLKVMHQKFPQYHISKAKEWPREDLNDQSSYDLPRFQFMWANGPSDDEYENDLKLWSIKTDGTDLRLITDEVNDYNIDAIVRSPNNRYVAWSGDSGSKHVYDLKTGQSYKVSVNGAPLLVWSADSRYLYYTRLARPRIMRWDSRTQKKQPIEMKISDVGVFHNQTYIRVTDTAVVGYKGQKRVFLLPANRKLTHQDRVFLAKSISPTGKYAWGSNAKYAWFFDTTNQSIKEFSGHFVPAQILGKDARYSALSKMAEVTVVDRQKQLVWAWQALGSGRLSGGGSLYNGFANHGLWFKGAN